MTHRPDSATKGPVMSFDLWTLTDWHELDRCIARDIETLDDAVDQAQDQANDRDRPIQILRDGNGSNYDAIYPEVDAHELGADPIDYLM